MAQAVNKTPPDTLPADFAGFDSAPETLPSGFFESPVHGPDTATISAATKPTWLQDAEADVRAGGNRTMIGKILGRMQGSDKYSGTGGVSEGVQNFMASPVLGLLHAGQGAQEIPQHPVTGTLKAAGGLLEAGTIPSMVMGGPGSAAAIEAVPSSKHAAGIFRSVMEDASKIPVNPVQSSDALLRVQELGQRGSVMPKAAKQLLERFTQPGGSPVTYQEARDFASNISRISADEAQRLTPVMKNALGDLRATFNRDVGEAASAVGRGEDYAKAMKEYAKAYRVSDALNKVAKWGIPTIVGGGIAAKILGSMVDSK